MPFEFPIFVNISLEIRQCSCCGKSNLKRTLHLSSPEIDDLFLGVICAGKRFKLNLTGNYWYAAKKLEKYLRKLDEDELEEILTEIYSDQGEWK